jgi:chromosome partitioning protein
MSMSTNPPDEDAGAPDPGSATPSAGPDLSTESRLDLPSTTSDRFVPGATEPASARDAAVPPATDADGSSARAEARSDASADADVPGVSVSDTDRSSGPADPAAVSGSAGGFPAAAPSALALGPTGRVLPTFPAPAPLFAHGPARILALCNQKGGVGKTTTTINLGAALAGLGRRVLLVDFDPQGALSVGLGVNPGQLDRTVYTLLMDSASTADDILLKTSVAGMDLLPSNIDLSAAEVQLVGEVARERTLLRALEPVVADYDFILIDCQPSLGLLTVNALTASHGVIIPLECEYFALRGVALLMQTIDKVKERLNPSLEVEGFLATMYDARTLHSREVLARLVEVFGDAVYHTVINRTIRFPETTVVGQPITDFAPSSPGAVAYRALARELLAA